ncbi:MAG: hypothetical protein Kow00121_30570 [Elainellaceae cyanobacterium]
MKTSEQTVPTETYCPHCGRKHEQVDHRSQEGAWSSLNILLLLFIGVVIGGYIFSVRSIPSSDRSTPEPQSYLDYVRSKVA